METKNIMLGGVGGQGLVLTTDVICKAALKAGYDVKSNDVIGLAQRGGMVWGSVRIGKKVHSPNIPVGKTDILLGLEPLEGQRWEHLLNENTKVIVNTKEIYPTPSLLEKVAYPSEEISEFFQRYEHYLSDFSADAGKLGNRKAANTVLLGVMAQFLPIPVDIWKETLRENVPEKAIEVNMKAFDYGYENFKPKS
ncbi:indolepyruvate oxidoreductase subunit beta [Isachenkonia alkalipeptolytica]|uniref:Pyruvate ferredoxin oxidoreductase n=1 Tax=Isachenkonia alkalipeptolytica TaxID=2565777 RepID=A0AA43XLB1_9CLOT|nr:indolepyruvate oxidoreductase subunit beta [Isachenkonia alkalipeptolytica]NBG87965.1 pyruvate ferredoxin oxidoreductase [Isachenkonia alkalipeptolytica]